VVLRAAVVAGFAAAACAPVARVGAPCSGPRPFAPFDERPASAVDRTSVVDRAQEADGMLDAIVGWYQQHGRARVPPGAGCPFAPTCSVYAREALRRYGPLGVVLIVDRLIVREHAVAGAYYPTICVARTTRLVDPPGVDPGPASRRLVDRPGVASPRLVDDVP
jgi:putative component of membrane protein insertase Oxa1/YidC/SpoIIIJ protein YidD